MEQVESEIFIHCIYFYNFWVWNQYLLILNYSYDELEAYLHVDGVFLKNLQMVIDKGHSEEFPTLFYKSI